jgi:hypothetical protein
MRARLLTAQSLVNVHSQPFVRQLVTRWISLVVRQAHRLRGQARDIGPLGVLHMGSRERESLRRELPRALMKRTSAIGNAWTPRLRRSMSK